MSRQLTMQCGHCRHVANVRSSREMTATYREVTFRCTNDLCGHSWVADLIAVRTTSPSACPNPDVQLPFARNVLMRTIVHQMELALMDAAND
ncbi:ogr/Delta-like zinc finger family protein [Lysobacter sp. CA199]|uniref:ogr/Delta-like zinc finger family protein n=1 Tax=Lysobacter sp. CA199 TaxID=3455608 RepID=UPI003F8D824A